MHVIMTSKLKLEQKQFCLQACCEDCRHFCNIRESCGMAYPVSEHRQQKFENAKVGDRIYFCKMFEAKDA